MICVYPWGVTKQAELTRPILFHFYIRHYLLSDCSFSLLLQQTVKLSHYCHLLVCEILWNHWQWVTLVHPIHSVTSGQTFQRVSLILHCRTFSINTYKNTLQRNYEKRALASSKNFFKDSNICCIVLQYVIHEGRGRRRTHFFIDSSLVRQCSLFGVCNRRMKTQLNFLSCVRLQEADKQGFWQIESNSYGDFI